MALKIASVVSSGRRGIQARCKDSLKAIVKFIMTESHQTESRLSLE
jgi:hypothetical protein